MIALAGLFPGAAPADGSPEVVWQVPRLGQVSSEPVLGPNGLFYLAAGNKLIVVDGSGRKLLEAAGSTGSAPSRPVFDAYGSIFLPGSSLIQEIKLNGSKGWTFAVYQDESNSKNWLSAGPGKLLYLPLSGALYAVDTVGHYKWVMLQWESLDAYRSEAVTKRKVLACAGNEKAVFVVLSEGKDKSSLIAVNGEGRVLWRYWLGEVSSANLVTGSEGIVYLSVNPNKIDDLNKGRIYAFDSSGDGKPLWSYSLPYNNLTAPTPTSHGLVYFCAGERLVVLNQADGREAGWQKFYKAISRPAVDEVSRRIYLGTEDNRLVAVSPQLRLEWDMELDGKVSQRPLTGPDGYIYVVTDTGTMYKIKDQAALSTGE